MTLRVYARRALAIAGVAMLAACTAKQRPAPRPTPPPVVQTPTARPPAVAPKPKPKPQPPKPTWTARKVVADAIDVPSSAVTVAPGDSLARIAARTNVSVGALAGENQLAVPYRITVGQTLKVPAGRYHRVKPGETGIAIARAYGAPWDRIVSDNRLAPPFALAAGQMLRVPSAKAVAALSLEDRAKAFRIDIDDLITGSEPAKPTAAAKAPVGPVPRPVTEPTAFAGRFAWPIDGRIASGFGPKQGGRYNDGVNIKAPAGTPVRAAADGVVAYAGDELEGFGGLVIVKHGDGWVTAYAHNEALLVARGARVKRGDLIAKSGSTGSVDEPQLHFEIRRGRAPVDPQRYLPPR